MTFQNEAQAVTPKRDGDYGFAPVPVLLRAWSRQFQCLVSQAVTYKLSGQFHNQGFAIYKAEGGCNIPKFGWLVLYDDCCRWDSGPYNGRRDVTLREAARIITDIVLGWDPMNPVESLLKAAATTCGSTEDALRDAFLLSFKDGSNPFGGDSLGNFFNLWGMRRDPAGREHSLMDDYERYCLININGEDPAEVDQMFNDRESGDQWMAKLSDWARKNGVNTPLCCKPHRTSEGLLRFWINTGTSTVLDGWKTEADLEAITGATAGT